MTLVKRSNGMLPVFNSFFSDIFDDEWHNRPAMNYSRFSVPAVNILETDDEFKIEVAAPGMKKEDFKIEIDKSMLTISTEKEEKNEKTDDKECYTCKEFNYQSFRRSFTVPEEKVNSEQIKAKYEDGILRVSLPKREEIKPKPARMINIG